MLNFTNYDGGHKFPDPKQRKFVHCDSKEELKYPKLHFQLGGFIYKLFKIHTKNNLRVENNSFVFNYFNI